MTSDTPEATPGQAARSFEDMLADPGEQFDLRSELLASIAEYAAAPQATAGIRPREATPGQATERDAAREHAQSLAGDLDAAAQLAEWRAVAEAGKRHASRMDGENARLRKALEPEATAARYHRALAAAHADGREPRRWRDLGLPEQEAWREASRDALEGKP